MKRGMVVAPGGTCGDDPCWKPIGAKGWKYENLIGNADGVTQVILKGGDAGKPSVIIEGKGAALDPPAPISGDEYFDVDTDLVVQVHGSSPVNCWSQSYASAQVTKNDGAQFKAKSP